MDVYTSHQKRIINIEHSYSKKNSNHVDHSYARIKVEIEDATEDITENDKVEKDTTTEQLEAEGKDIITFDELSNCCRDSTMESNEGGDSVENMDGDSCLEPMDYKMGQMSGANYGDRVVDDSTVELSGYEGGDSGSAMDSSDGEFTNNVEYNRMDDDICDAGIEVIADSMETDTESAEILCQYPIDSPGRISVTKTDYDTLSPGTFLNDIIVDFMMKYMHNEILDQKFQQTVHVLPSQFYQRLTMSPPVGSMLDIQERNSNMSMAEKRYRRVSRWIRNVNFLGKSLVLIPICQMSHWFIIVLVMPGGEEPCMLVLDSMGGQQTTAADIIKEFLATERKTTFEQQCSNNIKILTPKNTNSEKWI